MIYTTQNYDYHDYHYQKQCEYGLIDIDDNVKLHGKA